jgi:uncharacterized protein (TIGR02646 family)
MRKILKQPISDDITSQLASKQQSIDAGTVMPNWRLSKSQRNEIKNKLYESQKYICCYCECQVDDANYHIEHFFEQQDRTDLIYNYNDNLLVSCEGDKEKKSNPETDADKTERLDNMSCGHKKTQTHHNGSPINYSKLLNPMQINPNSISYLNGLVEPNTNNTNLIDKVNYTKTRLQLDSIRLNNLRKDKINLVFQQLRHLTVSEQKKYITDLLDENQLRLPSFYSTIKSNFEFILNE